MTPWWLLNRYSFTILWVLLVVWAAIWLEWVR